MKLNVHKSDLYLCIMKPSRKLEAGINVNLVLKTLREIENPNYMFIHFETDVYYYIGNTEEN